MRRRNDKLIVAGLFSILVGVLPHELWAVDRFVVPPGTAGITSGTPYNAWTNAATNIQLAINASVSGAGETVWVSNGTYYLTNQINVNKVITLRGLNGASNTFVDGNNVTRCLYMLDDYGTVDGLTFQHGSNNTYGAGIYISKGNISNCWVISNVASYNGGISFTGPCTVNLCEIKFNMATNLSGGGMGGGSAVSRVFNSLIQGNYGYDYSGGVNLEGGVMSNCTIVANSNYSRGGGGISVASGAIAQDCRISNNWTLSSGGGVRVTGSGLVTNSIISSNWAGGNGGGAWLLSPAGDGIMLRNCTISNNESSLSGGGIAADNSGGSAYHCAIVNNRANGGYGGGGIFSYADINVFYHCQILNNTASLSGGGVYIRWQGTFSNCVIAGNRVGSGSIGGGICMSIGGKVRDCLIYNNVASNGGGIYLSTIVTYTGFVASCTIAGNSASNGGGVYLNGTITKLTNNIIYSNTVVISDPDIYAIGANTNAFTYCCANFTSFPPDLGNKTNNPLFNNPAGNNYRLALGSPCINAGTNLSWMTNANVFDMDDRVRIRYGTVDMGCYEHIFSGIIFSAH